MKAINKITVLLVAMLAFSSCGDLLDINQDPDASPTARPEELLTAAQGELAWIMEGRYNDIATLWAQYWTWGSGVSLGDAEKYISEATDNNNVWGSCYADALADLAFIVKTTDRPEYAGVSKVMQAYIFGYLVDHFGDIPFSSALQGAIDDGSVLSPTYDDDAAIYPQLVTLVDDAIALLQDPEVENEALNTLGDNDVIGGGNIDAWLKFAYSLKLKLLMRQSEVTDVGTEVAALIDGGDFIESSADRITIKNAGVSGDENPMYALKESGLGNFYIASNASINLLESLNDPRIDDFYNVATSGDFAGSHNGVDQGAIDLFPFTTPNSDFSTINDKSYAADLPTVLMSEWEVWFLRAEAAVRYSTSDDAATAFGNAVGANFAYLGTSGAGAYVASLGFGTGDDDDDLNLIGIQKWISCNGVQEAEGWVEAKRFDRSGDNIFTSDEGGIYQDPDQSTLGARQFPTVWVYPQTELSLNSNSPGQQALTEKVYWDN